MGNNNASTNKIGTPSLSYTDNFSKELVDLHLTSVKQGYKMLLFGCNKGKSDWFNGNTKHQTLIGITFKIISLDINNKLRKIKTIIYDTAEQYTYLCDTLHYITSTCIHGLILTYNIYNIKSIYHLEKSINKLQETLSKTIPFLLLGINECNNYNEFDEEITNNCIDYGQKFATKHNLFHIQIDLNKNINICEPYKYLLCKILKIDYSFHGNNNDSLINMISDIILDDECIDIDIDINMDLDVAIDKIKQKDRKDDIIILDNNYFVQNSNSSYDDSENEINELKLNRVHSRIPPKPPAKKGRHIKATDSKIPASFKQFKQMIETEPGINNNNNNN
eukprot:254717_1